MEAEMERHFARFPALSSCAEEIRDVFRRLVRMYRGGGRLLICGNGGSAADAAHIEGELMKDFRFSRRLPEGDRERLVRLFPDGGSRLADLLTPCLPALALGTGLSLASAVANDTAAEMVYAQQVYGLCGERDAVLGLTTSGSSPNVLNALKVARLRGAAVFAITGRGVSGMTELCDGCIHIPATETAQVQELMVPVYHLLCGLLEDAFFGGKGGCDALS
ncbi:D-sedoheptulose-7-phosphate isomerase [Kiritimatiella glycovorans]|uniref:Phosphoheptose isomerase 1 n=1 Tax=Kiritimatiella glycovorans TaxID=1307763 RepID=A0A0G3EE58_9BACT|nr:SIS domain-containing protein [Kiritimatiella glycovorans]AKJ63702.1 Phosphoheptose isomerase 1 [Kiritimatiella glycovorans]